MSALVVTVLMIFMLLERREFRDRVILLIGYRRMTATTRALDEVGARISRYLLMQSIINAIHPHDTQQALAQLGLTHGHPAPESPTTPAPEAVPWATLVNS